MNNSNQNSVRKSAAQLIAKHEQGHKDIQDAWRASIAAKHEQGHKDVQALEDDIKVRGLQAVREERANKKAKERELEKLADERAERYRSDYYRENRPGVKNESADSIIIEAAYLIANDDEVALSIFDENAQITILEAAQEILDNIDESVQRHYYPSSAYVDDNNKKEYREALKFNSKASPEEKLPVGGSTTFYSPSTASQRYRASRMTNAQALVDELNWKNGKTRQDAKDRKAAQDEEDFSTGEFLKDQNSEMKTFIKDRKTSEKAINKKEHSSRQKALDVIFSGTDSGDYNKIKAEYNKLYSDYLYRLRNNDLERGYNKNVKPIEYTEAEKAEAHRYALGHMRTEAMENGYKQGKVPGREIMKLKLQNYKQ